MEVITPNLGKGFLRRPTVGSLWNTSLSRSKSSYEVEEFRGQEGNRSKSVTQGRKLVVKQKSFFLAKELSLKRLVFEILFFVFFVLCKFLICISSPSDLSAKRCGIIGSDLFQRGLLYRGGGENSGGD